jgi:hypothetical protein
VTYKLCAEQTRLIFFFRVDGRLSFATAGAMLATLALTVQHLRIRFLCACTTNKICTKSFHANAVFLDAPPYRVGKDFELRI